MSKHQSKFLSLVLRHQPDLIGIVLDDAGWTDVETLLAKAAAKGTRITRDELSELVKSSDKQRFALSADGNRIRANQGHSVEVELDLPPMTPPATLLHGTVELVLLTEEAPVHDGLQSITHPKRQPGGQQQYQKQ